MFHHCYNNHVLTNGLKGHVFNIITPLPLRLSHCPHVRRRRPENSSHVRRRLNWTIIRASHSVLKYSLNKLNQKIPFSLYEGNPMTIRVINALVRLVHGGRGMEDSKSSRFKTKSSKLTKSPMRRRNIKKIASATECGHDEVPVRDE